jgi:hypothetical protein
LQLPSSKPVIQPPTLVSINDVKIAHDHTLNKKNNEHDNKEAVALQSTAEYKLPKGVVIPESPILVVREGAVPVDDMYNGEFWMRALPTLFWRGLGLPHMQHRKTLSLKYWIRHCLRVHHPHFRQHRSFPFIAMNILNRQLSMTQARLQVNGMSEATARKLSKLTSAEIDAYLKKCNATTGQGPQPDLSSSLGILWTQVKAAAAKVTIARQLFTVDGI